MPAPPTGPVDEAVLDSAAQAADRWVQPREFAPAGVSRCSPSASLPVVSLLINESGKDFINTDITVIPICYELNRLWKVGFGNAFHVLNRPRPDKLWE